MSRISREIGTLRDELASQRVVGAEVLEGASVLFELDKVSIDEVQAFTIADVKVLKAANKGAVVPV